jgi:N-ethylmaleimide reductase
LYAKSGKQRERTPLLVVVKRVADAGAVLEGGSSIAGGTIFAQLWHVGRVSHPHFHGGELPVAPCAIAPDGEVFTTQDD